MSRYGPIRMLVLDAALHAAAAQGGERGVHWRQVLEIAQSRGVGKSAAKATWKNMLTYGDLVRAGPCVRLPGANRQLALYVPQPIGAPRGAAAVARSANDPTRGLEHALAAWGRRGAGP